MSLVIQMHPAHIFASVMTHDRSLGALINSILVLCRRQFQLRFTGCPHSIWARIDFRLGHRRPTRALKHPCNDCFWGKESRVVYGGGQTSWRLPTTIWVSLKLAHAPMSHDVKNRVIKCREASSVGYDRYTNIIHHEMLSSKKDACVPPDNERTETGREQRRVHTRT